MIYFLKVPWRSISRCAPQAYHTPRPTLLPTRWRRILWPSPKIVYGWRNPVGSAVVVVLKWLKDDR